MSPDDLEKIKVVLRDEYQDMLEGENDVAIRAEVLSALAELNTLETFEAVLRWMKTDQDDLYSAFSHILYAFCPSADDGDVQTFLKVGWTPEW